MGKGDDEVPRTRHLLLTGRPGSGKTTIIRRAVEGRRDAGGFYTSEVREAGRRTGFSINTLDGRAGVLASESANSNIRVGRYRVNVEDIEGVAVTAIAMAINDTAVRVIVIDEIASMEMSSPRFLSAVTAALEGPKRVLGTIQAKKHPFLDAIRSREDVTLIEVSASNREDLPGLLGRWLEGA